MERYLLFLFFYFEFFKKRKRKKENFLGNRLSYKGVLFLFLLILISPPGLQLELSAINTHMQTHIHINELLQNCFCRPNDRWMAIVVITKDRISLVTRPKSNKKEESKIQRR